MIRRAVWLSAGFALGAGGSLWARRQAGVVSARLQSGRLDAELAALARRGARVGTTRMRHALDAGRASAHRREDQLWHDLEVRARRR